MGNRIVAHFILNPKALFLTDCIGALITSFSLFFILPNIEGYFTMPVDILVALSIATAMLFLYSVSCFLFLKRNWSTYLWVIITANSLYCLLTTILMIVYYPSLTVLDLIYFFGEIGIIAMLVFIEYKVALVKALNKDDSKLK